MVNGGRPAVEAMDIGAFSVLGKPIVLDRMPEVVRSTAPAGDSCSVVVADYDADLRRIMGETLAGAGCTVRAAADGEEALDVMRVVSADVAVLDLVMPRGDGLLTMARMRENMQLRDIPVVMLVAGELLASEMNDLQESAERLHEHVDVPFRRTLDIVLEICETRIGLADTAG